MGALPAPQAGAVAVTLARFRDPVIRPMLAVAIPTRQSSSKMLQAGLPGQPAGRREARHETPSPFFAYCPSSHRGRHQPRGPRPSGGVRQLSVARRPRAIGRRDPDTDRHRHPADAYSIRHANPDGDAHVNPDADLNGHRHPADGDSLRYTNLDGDAHLDPNSDAHVHTNRYQHAHGDAYQYARANRHGDANAQLHADRRLDHNADADGDRQGHRHADSKEAIGRRERRRRREQR